MSYDELDEAHRWTPEHARDALRLARGRRKIAVLHPHDRAVIITTARRHGCHPYRYVHSLHAEATLLGLALRRFLRDLVRRG